MSPLALSSTRACWRSLYPVPGFRWRHAKSTHGNDVECTARPAAVVEIQKKEHHGRKSSERNWKCQRWVGRTIIPAHTKRLKINMGAGGPLNASVKCATWKNACFAMKQLGRVRTHYRFRTNDQNEIVAFTQNKLTGRIYQLLWCAVSSKNHINNR